jgi:hypothetical protein
LPDADQAPDPKLAGELAVVMMLRRSAAATAPAKDARDRMRAAVLAGLAATGSSPVIVPSPVPRPKPGRKLVAPPKSAARPERRLPGARGRVAIAMAAAFCLLLVLSGMTLLLSRNALPGDPLYGVRRTVESATLGLTSGDEAKGLKHLEYASDTVGDIETLAARYPDLKDSPVGDYLTAFGSFDSDARAGTAELTGYATSHNDGVLSTLHDWAEQQAGRIQQVQRTLPAPAASESDKALTLLSRIVARADAIASRNACYTITSGSTDDLGVLPATGPCDRAPAVGSTLSTSGIPGAGGTIVGQVPPSAPANSGGAARSVVAPPTTTTFTPKAPPPVPTGGLLPTITLTPKTSPAGVTLPLPLPGITVPPLLPGLPGLRIGR